MKENACMDIPTLLDAAKLRQEFTSDYQLAKALSLHPARVSAWRSGRDAIDDYNLLRISNMAEVNHSQALAARALAKERDEEKRRFWHAIERAAACAFAAGFAASFIPNSANAYSWLSAGGSGQFRQKSRHVIVVFVQHVANTINAASCYSAS